MTVRGSYGLLFSAQCKTGRNRDCSKVLRRTFRPVSTPERFAGFYLTDDRRRAYGHAFAVPIGRATIRINMDSYPSRSPAAVSTAGRAANETHETISQDLAVVAGRG